MVTEQQIIRAKEQNVWDFGNNILYNMCSENIAHTDESVVIGKIWIIGRSYSTSIERRKINNSDDIENGDFYTKFVAPTMLINGKELDYRIRMLQAEERLTRDNIKDVIALHKFVVDLFFDVSGVKKRSLASKYLHFHLPHIVYMYDSRAEIEIKKYVKKAIDIKSLIGDSVKDEEYANFMARVLMFDELIQEEFNEKLTPKQLDAILMKY